MDYGVVAVQKQFIGSMHYEVYTRDYGNQTGTYICTLDNYHQDVDAIDYSTSEQPAEHKSHNLLELDNGQFCLYPNNRMRIYDNSITPETPKNPDFKVSTVYYQVENGHDRDGLGSEENYFWKTAKERAFEAEERTLDVSVGAGNTDLITDDFITEGYYTEGMNITIDEPPELGWKLKNYLKFTLLWQKRSKKLSTNRFVLIIMLIYLDD